MNASDLPDETLFEGALKCRTPEERAAYLDQHCAGQPALRRNLEALLAAHEASGEFLEPTVAVARPTIKLDLPVEETPGTMIGRYKLLQKIGEGGMGVVYMAEQTEPVVRRVALKIIKLGMDTKAVVARFEAERQALALMDHPNIAKVLDAGAVGLGELGSSGCKSAQTSEVANQSRLTSAATIGVGRPYFVMELVHGVPITEYCDKNKLSTQQRLELFIPVCQAIQHAHQKGIIHRDIKPSNVMVTLHDGVPVPKVIDFGVAKATNQRLTEKTLFTHYAQMIGTPAYMSPEQAEMSGLDIDTRSDIYSLGVLLYELLTGTTPFDAKELLSKGYAEMQRIIAEQEPAKPSTRMSTLTDEERTVVAKNRGMDAGALRRGMQGDLDWIVMKCLEKDRTRRYETSNGLAADLRRHLSNELISARPPTTGYLLKKLIRRNKTAFATGTAVVIALLIGVIATTWQAVRAHREEVRAKTEAATSTQIAKFLTEMLAGVEPSVAAGRDTALLREILENTEKRIAKEPGDPSAAKAVVLRILAQTYRELELFEKAETLGRESLRHALGAVGENHAHTVNAMKQLSATLWERNKITEARDLQLRMMAIAEKHKGPESMEVAEMLSYYARSCSLLSDNPAADTSLQRAIALMRKHNDAEGLSAALNNYAEFVFGKGDFTRAESIEQEAVGICRTAFGESDPRTLSCLGNLSQIQVSLGKAEAAEASFRELIKQAPTAFGENSRNAAFSHAGLADALSRQGRKEEAIEHYRKSLAVKRVVFGEPHPQVALGLRLLATALTGSGERAKADEAGELYQQCSQMWQTLTNRAQEPAYADLLGDYGNYLAFRRQYTPAEPLLNSALQIRTNLDGPHTIPAAQIRMYLGFCRTAQGDVEAGRQQLQQAAASVAAMPIRWTDAAPTMEEFCMELAENFRLAGDYREAEKLRRLALEKRSLRLPAAHLEVAACKGRLGHFLAEWAWQERQTPQNDVQLQRVLEADKLTGEALALAQGGTNQITNVIATAMIHRGAALFALATLSPTLTVEERRKHFVEAESLLQTGREQRVEPEIAPYSTNRRALEWLIRLNETWEALEPGIGKAAKAARWQAELSAFDEKARANAIPTKVTEPKKPSSP